MHIFKINKGFEITSSLHKMLWPWLFINIHYLFIIYLSLYFSFIKSTRFLAIHCLILAWLISDQYMYNLFIPSPLSCLKFIYFTHYRSSLMKIYSLITFLCIVYFNISMNVVFLTDEVASAVTIHWQWPNNRFCGEIQA